MDENTLKNIAAQLRQPKGDQAIWIGEEMNIANRHINLYTIAELKPTKNDNILEIGMGNGHFVSKILNHDTSIKYTGCDYSEPMVEEASKYNQKHIDAGQAQFYHASADKLPFISESFDKVFTINTIYFWENISKVLSEIYRVLKPNGLIFIAGRPKRVMELYPFAKFGFNMFEKDDLIHILSEERFKVVGIQEKEEPESEINGEPIPLETLIVSAEKQ